MWRILIILALLTGPLLGAVPKLLAQEAERCFEATLSAVKDCDADVLSTSGLFCPSKEEIRDRICQRIRKKEGERVDIRCEGSGECVSRSSISGAVTRTFELQRQKLSCTVRFEVKVTAELAGTGTIGRCGTASASVGSPSALFPAAGLAFQAEPGETPGEAEAGEAAWLETLVTEAVDEALLLPTIEGGKVEGLDPKANALLETVLEDYRRLGARPGVQSPNYVAIAGTADPDRVVAGSGELQGRGLPSGLYTLVLGEEFDRVPEAMVIAAWREKNEIRRARLHLRWDGDEWVLREARRYSGTE